jgi:hypothetical protein
MSNADTSGFRDLPVHPTPTPAEAERMKAEFKAQQAARHKARLDQREAKRARRCRDAAK